MRFGLTKALKQTDDSEVTFNIALSRKEENSTRDGQVVDRGGKKGASTAQAKESGKPEAPTYSGGDLDFCGVSYE